MIRSAVSFSENVELDGLHASITRALRREGVWLYPIPFAINRFARPRRRRALPSPPHRRSTRLPLSRQGAQVARRGTEFASCARAGGEQASSPSLWRRSCSPLFALYKVRGAAPQARRDPSRHPCRRRPRGGPEGALRRAQRRYPRRRRTTPTASGCWARAASASSRRMKR